MTKVPVRRIFESDVIHEHYKMQRYQTRSVPFGSARQEETGWFEFVLREPTPQTLPELYALFDRLAESHKVPREHYRAIRVIEEVVP